MTLASAYVQLVRTKGYIDIKLKGLKCILQEWL